MDFTVAQHAQHAAPARSATDHGSLRLLGLDSACDWFRLSIWPALWRSNCSEVTKLWRVLRYHPSDPSGGSQVSDRVQGCRAPDGYIKSATPAG